MFGIKSSLIISIYIQTSLKVNPSLLPILNSLPSSKNGIICDTKFYKSLSGFAVAHYTIDTIDRTDRVTSNGWKECECEVNGKWIYTFNL